MRALRPDVAVLDLALPGLDALRLLRLARRNRLVGAAVALVGEPSPAAGYRALEPARRRCSPRAAGRARPQPDLGCQPRLRLWRQHHLAHLYDKLGVSERAACVAEAMRRGLLD